MYEILGKYLDEKSLFERIKIKNFIAQQGRQTDAATAAAAAVA